MNTRDKRRVAFVSCVYVCPTFALFYCTMCSHRTRFALRYIAERMSLQNIIPKFSCHEIFKGQKRMSVKASDKILTSLKPPPPLPPYGSFSTVPVYKIDISMRKPEFLLFLVASVEAL